ncbi:MAG: GrpB family protein [Bacteroidota bacterium]
MARLITVVDYNPRWPQAFEQEAALLRQALSDALVEIHHIGSTSVPGLAAKPIIDILPEVHDLALLDARAPQMEALGYEVMGEFGIPGRRYFRKGGDERTHHVHAFLAGDAHAIRHLAFRDYLIAHPEVAQAYGQLKREVAQRSNNNIETYGDGKDPFIKIHERKALEWYAKLQ